MPTQITNEMIASYRAYLELVQTRLLDKYFLEQKPYICCKAGCSYCCEHGQYPVTELELSYLIMGYKLLHFSIQNIVKENFEKLKVEYLKYLETNNKFAKNKPFMYRCPFLIDGRCSVYEYRAMICRTHGLMFFVTDNDGVSHNKIPYCVNLGLNYSNIYDEKTGMLSEEKMEDLGITQKPLAYNLSLKALFNKEITKELNFEFGESKALIEWFVEHHS